MKTPQKPENPLLNLGINIFLPAVILSKFSDAEQLGPVWALVAALVFPLGYGIYDNVARKKWNLFSVIGFTSILLTGGLGLLQVAPIWIAVKEASIPLIFGSAILLSLKTKQPLVRTFLMSPQIINVEKVESSLEQFQNRPAFDKLLVQSSFLLAGSFLLSAVLNFALAVYLLKSPPGTTEFNHELGRMTALSFPVIAVPSMLIMMLALWLMLREIKKLTHLEFEDIFLSHDKESPGASTEQ